MLAIILTVLSIIGIILLILLGVLVLILLLVLVFPISYKIRGNKTKENIFVSLKAKWLFGFIRVKYDYPKPGTVKVKLLFFDLLKKKEESEKTSTETINKSLEKQESGNVKEKPQNDNLEKEPAEAVTTLEASDVEDKSTKKSLRRKILEKYENIKYTIKKIYDKIKHIWENICFYKELLFHDDTKELIKHAFKRVGNILKKLKPKKLKADILFGTGEPDTTGYALGVYGILSPHIHKPSYVNLTPDFENKVIEGTIEAKGHIMIFTVLSNAVKLLLDKRLRRLYSKIKKHNTANEPLKTVKEGK